MDQKESIQQKKKKLANIFNQILKIEYGIIFLCPRYFVYLGPTKTLKKLMILRNAEVEHADILAKEIIALGATPNWNLSFIKFHGSLINVLNEHLKNEKMSIKLLKKCIKISPTKRYEQKIRSWIKEESEHQKLILKIEKELYGGRKLESQK